MSLSTRGPGGRSSVHNLEQIILSRIARGEYPAGFRLPSCEQLGRELGANKNTISKVYQALARRGYTVSNPGRGTFVAKQPSRAWGDGKAVEVSKLLGDAIAQAGAFGLSAEELEALAIETIRRHFSQAHLRVGYVDCNRLEARELARDLEVALSAPVIPMTVTDVGGTPSRGGDVELLAVNVAHLRAVERRLRGIADNRRPLVVPVIALPDAKALTQVALLPAGTRLVVVADTQEVLHGLDGLARGVNQAADVSAFLSSSPDLEDVLARADAVLVTRTANRRLVGRIGERPTIVASFKLDEDSIARVAEHRSAMQNAADEQAAPRANPQRRSKGAEEFVQVES